MRVVFDMQKLQTRIMMAMIIMATFTVIYMIIPREEFGMSKNYDNVEIDNVDILQFSILSQVCANSERIYPKTIRTKILSICHLILGYAVFLI